MLQGKYVEIQFSRGGEPTGGRVSNFLLEKVFAMNVVFLKVPLMNTQNREKRNHAILNSTKLLGYNYAGIFAPTII